MADGPLLVVNGVESRLQIVLGDREGLLWSHESTAPGRLMTRLAPALDWMFKAFDLSVADLGGIAAVRGPGSFTGVRLVLATVLGLSRGGSVPQAGLDYLPLLAAGPATLLHGELWVCTHARHDQVYLQGFTCPHAEPVHPARAVGLEEAASLLATRSLPFHLVGSGCRKNRDWLHSHGLGKALLPPAWDLPATTLLLACARGAAFSTSPVTPCYLRSSDAEENLPGIAAGRGLSEEEARCGLTDFELPG